MLLNKFFKSFKGGVIVFAALSLMACETIPKKETPAKTYPDGMDGPDSVLTDPQGYGQPDMPFAVGEVLTQNRTVYREFLGMTEEGAYVVHEYYISSNTKRTDPYQMLSANELKTFMLEDAGRIQEQYTLLTEAGVLIDGPYVQWYSDGQPAIKGNYKKGVPVGDWTIYYSSNGKPLLQDHWEDGMKNGVAKGWYESGSRAGEGTWKDGRREGHWVLWYANGKKMEEGKYVRDVKEGDWIFYYDNGSKKESGAYTLGKRTGLWQWWSREGELVREGDYSDEEALDGTGSTGGGYGSGTIQRRAP